ncbi:MAG: hypothetical protein HYZ21_07690 [Chloroflexi bacterium]|nr:hypothetical protein [Chloroflexota bacterium]
MLDMSSEIIRTLITTIITTAGGILSAYLINKRRSNKQTNRSITIGAFAGVGIGIVLGITLAVFWPTGDPCLEARISAPIGTKEKAHAAAYQVNYEIPVSWTPPSGEKCVMTVQTYQKANPVPVREYKNVVIGTILNLGDPGSGETEIKIWVEGYATQVDYIWVWIK